MTDRLLVDQGLYFATVRGHEDTLAIWMGSVKEFFTWRSVGGKTWHPLSECSSIRVAQVVDTGVSVE